MPPSERTPACALARPGGRRTRPVAPARPGSTHASNNAKAQRRLPTTQWDRLGWRALSSAFVAEQACDAGTARHSYVAESVRQPDRLVIDETIRLTKARLYVPPCTEAVGYSA
jgi:hypothetical protein